MKTTKSPYLSTSNRLADVIAALQATATYKFYQVRGGWGVDALRHRNAEAGVRLPGHGTFSHQPTYRAETSTPSRQGRL